MVFIPTAANPYKKRPWIAADRDALTAAGFQVFNLDIENKTKKELREILKNANIIFVAGGNTFYLLEKAKKSGFDKIVKDLVSTNIIYIGSSAGSIILGPGIEFAEAFDDPNIAQLDSTKGFMLIDFIPLPHYEKENPDYKDIIKEYGLKYTLVPITNDQIILVDDDGYHVI